MKRISCTSQLSSLTSTLLRVAGALLGVAFLSISQAAETRVLHAGYDTGLVPISFSNDKHQPDGFAIDLLRRFAEKKGYALQWQPLTPASIKAELSAPKLELIAGLDVRDAALETGSPSLAFLHLQAEIYVRKGISNAGKWETLKPLRFVAAPESHLPDVLQKQFQTAPACVALDSYAAALEALHLNRADATALPKDIAAYFLADRNYEDVLPAGLSTEALDLDLAAYFPASERRLLVEFNSFIEEARRDGTLASLAHKWSLENTDAAGTSGHANSLWLYGLLAFIPLVIIYLVQRRLLRQVRKQAEALRVSEERLTLIVEGSEDAFWDWDVVTGFVERSDQWTRFLGYPREKIPAHIDAFLNLIHPDDFSRLEHAKRHILQDGQCRVEYRLKGVDGNWRWIYDRGKVVARDAAGNPTRVTGAATDVTLRKRIEHALVRSQAILEQTQEAAGMGGWEFDIKTQAFFWTKQVFRIYCLDTEDEFIPLERVVGFCTNAHQRTFQTALKRAVEEGIPFDLEIELTTARNQLIWVRYIGRVEQVGASTTRVYGSIQNITERRKSEDEREKLQVKMLEAQKLESLGVLAGGIAHDFNNILTVIMGSASLAKEEPSMVSESLEHIQTAANRAADLCRQMLAYAGKSRFSLEIHDLNEIVRGTADLLKLSIRKTAELEFKFDPSVLAVEADSSQIRQVIMNLVINASDAIGDNNGQIRVTTRVDEFTREKLREARIGQDAVPGRYVIVEVSDNGGGMSAETMNRIFDPFFTTKFTGRGLGLAAVLGIVRAHKGAFFVRSSLGKGSAFTMLLPPSDVHPPEHIEEAPTKSGKSEKMVGKILVVDDEPEVRKIAGTILEKQGYTVTLASDGYEALALALAHGMQFRCVVLDLTMPGLDGPSTYRELRALSRTVPILIMSGFSEADARKHISVDSRVAFLPKPFPAEELVRKVNAMPLPPHASNPPFTN